MRSFNNERNTTTSNSFDTSASQSSKCFPRTTTLHHMRHGSVRTYYCYCYYHHGRSSGTAVHERQDNRNGERGSLKKLTPCSAHSPLPQNSLSSSSESLSPSVKVVEPKDESRRCPSIAKRRLCAWIFAMPSFTCKTHKHTTHSHQGFSREWKCGVRLGEPPAAGHHVHTSVCGDVGFAQTGALASKKMKESAGASRNLIGQLLRVFL